MKPIENMTKEELMARLHEIGEAAGTAHGEELDALRKEAEDINAAMKDAKTREEIMDAAKGAMPTGKGEKSDPAESEAAARGKALKARKAVIYKNTLTSSEFPLQKHVGEGVTEGFNDVSGLVDMVKPTYLPGGESYQRAFEKSAGTGDYKAEGAAYATAEPVYGYATLAKTKITAYTEEPEEIVRLGDAEFDAVIGASAPRAVRKKLAKEIMVGNGASGHLCGIFYKPSSADDDIIDRNTDLSIAAIDKDTLDEIIYNYGGDEDVEGGAYLILNKKDLKAFATARKSNGEKAYTVVNHGSTGTIDGVPYVINSACKSLGDESTDVGDYVMAYGPLKNYELAIFSDMEVKRSDEFKFSTGQIAHRASIFVGGNVVARNGFIRVKKKSAD